MNNVHSTAIVDSSAEIDPTARIGPYVVIGPHCVIGPECELQAFSRLVSHVTLDERVRVHSSAILGDIPQHTAYKEHPGRIRIGSGTILREGVTIHRPHVEGGETRIGRNCFLMANSHAAHDVVLEDGVILINGALLGGHVLVGEKAIVSGNALVQQFGEIGRLAMVSGGSEMAMDVPPFCTVMGRNELKGLNVVGLRRAGCTSAQRRLLKRIFVVALRIGSPLHKNIEQAESLLDGIDPEEARLARELLDFLKVERKRGVVRLHRDEAAAQDAEE